MSKKPKLPPRKKPKLPPRKKRNSNDLAIIQKWIAENVKDNGHSLISPSWSHTWVNCTGSLIEIDKLRLKSTDNIASVEGTIAHGLLEACLKKNKMPGEITINDLMVTGVLDDLESMLDNVISNDNNGDDVIEYAKDYKVDLLNCMFDMEMNNIIGDVVKEINVYRKKGYEIYPEIKVDLTGLIGHSQCNGTSDILLRKESHIITADLKYGKGIEVSPDNNYQLQIYSIGAIEKLGIAHSEIEKIDIVIIQPRINNGIWKLWETDIESLLKFTHDVIKPKSIAALQVLKTSIEASYVPDNIFSPSTKTCEWCLRKSICKSRHVKAKKDIKALFKKANMRHGKIVDFEDLKLSDEDLIEMSHLVPFVKSVISNIDSEIEKRTLSKKGLKGYKLVQGRMNRKWKYSKPDAQIKAFRELGLSPVHFMQAKVKSPPQLEKTIMPKDLKTKVLSELMVVTHGRPIAVPNSDNRESVNKRGVNVKKMFKDIDNEKSNW